MDLCWNCSSLVQRAVPCKHVCSVKLLLERRSPDDSVQCHEAAESHADADRADFAVRFQSKWTRATNLLA